MKRYLLLLTGTLFVSIWLRIVMPWPLAVAVSACGLVMGTSAVWVLAGWIGPWVMGGCPLRDAVDTATAEALEKAAAEYGRRLGMRAPRLYVIWSPQANALACGVGPSAAVAFTAGMIDTLGVRELRAVLAHELGHLHAGDTFIICVATVTGGLVRLAASTLSLAATVAFLVVRVAAGLLGTRDLVAKTGSCLQRSVSWAWLLCDRVVALVAACISRQAEFEADRLGAQLAGRQAMLTALCRIEGLNTQVQPPGWLARMYATHPPVRDRIEALREVAA